MWLFYQRGGTTRCTDWQTPLEDVWFKSTATAPTHGIIFSNYEDGFAWDMGVEVFNASPCNELGAALSCRANVGSRVNNLVLDNVSIEVASCASVQGLNISNVASNSAQVNWNVIAGVFGYDYFLNSTIVPDVNTVPTGTTTNTFQLLNDLLPNTTYKIWVRSNCGATNGSSSWEMVTFVTQCDMYNVPYYDGLNGLNNDCWTILDANDDGLEWSFTDWNTYEGSGALYYSPPWTFWDEDVFSDDWVISPLLNLNSVPGHKRLRFKYKVEYGDGIKFEVKYSTTGAGVSNFTQTLVPVANYTNESYAELIANLVDQNNNPLTGVINIAIHIPEGEIFESELFIDPFIVELIPDCEGEIKKDQVCQTAETVSISWLPANTEQSWEYVLNQPIDGAPLTNGTVTNGTDLFMENLIPETDYILWVRIVCADGGVGVWTPISFRTDVHNVTESNPFCAGAEGIVFPNQNDLATGGIDKYGSIACLGSTPNPVWYYLEIEDSGNLEFTIIQNTQFDANGNPTGDELDVDYVAWGPFDSLAEACLNIDMVPCPDCPNNTLDTNYYPSGNIIDCSYDASDTETLTIENAQQGQVYAILITNFDGNPGFIKLVQDNIGEEGAGSTDCSFLCSVTLGEDILACEDDEIMLTAILVAAGASEINSIKWYKNGELMEPAIYNQLQITVTESGVYKVEIDKENCAEDLLTDEVLVEFVGKFKDDVEDELFLCDEKNDNTEDFDLTSYLNQFSNNENFSFSLHPTNQSALNGTGNLTGLYSSGNATIYLRVQSKKLYSCFVVIPVILNLYKIEEPDNISKDQIICNLFQLPVLMNNQKYTKYELMDQAGFVIEENNIVNVEELLRPGFYKIYFETVSKEGCINISSFNITVLSCIIPKGISPNGDGENDNLDLTDYMVQEIKIYNRYGKEVYNHGVGYTNQWNGQDSGGELLPTGTYYYNIITPFEQFTGYIHLVREIK